MQLRKKKTRDGDWIVANDSTGGHAHFDTKFGANVMIFLLKNNIEPYDPHFIEAKRRLLEEPKKNKKKKNNQKYYNNQLIYINRLTVYLGYVDCRDATYHNG